jgi:hypothetical protein
MIYNRPCGLSDDRRDHYRSYDGSGDGNGVAGNCEAEPPPVSIPGRHHPVVDDLVGLLRTEQGVEALPFMLEAVAYLEELADLGAEPVEAWESPASLSASRRRGLSPDQHARRAPTTRASGQLWSA